MYPISRSLSFVCILGAFLFLGAAEGQNTDYERYGVTWAGGRLNVVFNELAYAEYPVPEMAAGITYEPITISIAPGIRALVVDGRRTALEEWRSRHQQGEILYQYISRTAEVIDATILNDYGCAHNVGFCIEISSVNSELNQERLFGQWPTHLVLSMESMLYHDGSPIGPVLSETPRCGYWGRDNYNRASWRSAHACALLLITSFFNELGAQIDSYIRDDLIGSLEEGALSGDAQSQYELALRYISGRGVERDADRGRELLNASADQRYAPALASLAAMNLDGEFLPPNCPAAGRLIDELRRLQASEAEALVDQLYAPLGGAEGLSMPRQVQFDLLEAQTINALSTRNYPEFLSNLCALEATGLIHDLPGEARVELDYHRAVALREAGQPAAALEALNRYLAEAGSSGASYQDALLMLRPLTAEARQ